MLKMVCYAIEIKISGDGSTTIFIPEINEHYHSYHGAIQESNHIFIKEGLLKLTDPDVNVLEVGFGTGLNTYLTVLNKAGKKIRYHSIEKYPLPVSIINSLNYPTILQPGGENNLFKLIHQSPWGIETNIDTDFWLNKFNTDLLNFESDKEYNLVYFDAFAPEKQPELWTFQVFEKINKLMSKNGVLTTYCVKGIVKRAIKEAGFSIELIPGPPGKREILRAVKL